MIFFQNPQVPASSVIDAGSLHILEQLKFGKINVRQAADLLKVDPTILAYELAAKVSIFSSFSEFKKITKKLFLFFCSKAMRMDPLHGDQDHGDVDDEEEEYHDMEVQPDVVLHDDLDDEEDVSIILTLSTRLWRVKIKFHVF